MSGDLLREAAALLRQRAEAATPGPWRALSDGYGDTSGGSAEVDRRDLLWVRSPVTGGDIVSTYGMHGPRSADDAIYIATMHPGAGLAVAELLEKAHCGLDCDADGMREPYCSACSDSTFDHECPDRKPCRHTASYQDALAVARAILGRQP